MSYSRWSSSFWYTYWCVHAKDSGIPENRDNACFEICLADNYLNFTAYELRTEIDKCLQKIWVVSEVETYSKPEKLKQELNGFIGQFLKDIDETYPASHHNNPL